MKAWWRRFTYRRYVFCFIEGRAYPVYTPLASRLVFFLCGLATGHGLIAVLRAVL